MIIDRLYEGDPVVWTYRQEVYDDCVFIPVVAFAEKMQGWLDRARASRNDERKFSRCLKNMIGIDRFMADYPILPYSEEAIATYDTLSKAHGLGRNDIRIAACALAHGLVVATANQRHFSALLPPEQLVDWTLKRSIR